MQKSNMEQWDVGDDASFYEDDDVYEWDVRGVGKIVRMGKNEPKT